MEKICLDFETALDFLRGESSIIEKMKYYADREEVCITSLTLYQLMEVINRAEVVNAFANSVTVLPFDRNAAKLTASISKDLEEQGDASKRMEVIFTAAVCIANDAHVFSRSKSKSKYEGIKGLKKV
jgi:predicted nucleic acid-binding protein